MPVYSYQSPDGRVVKLEGDSPATEQELESIFSTLAPVSAPAPVATPSIEDQINQRFIRSEQASPISQAIDRAKGLGEMVIAPFRAIGGAVSELAGAAGEQSAQPMDLSTRLKYALIPASNPLLQNLAQTGLETAGRTAFDLGNSINELVSSGANQVVNNPLETALSLAFPAAGGALSLRSRTPTQAEVDANLQSELRGRGVAAVKSEPLVPEVLGEANIPLANELELALQALPVAPKAIRGAAGVIESGATKLKSGVDTVRSRGIFKQPLTAATTEALGITPIEGAADLIPVVKKSVLDANGGKIPTGVSGQELLDRAADFKINQYVDGLKLAEQQGLRHSIQSLVQAMEQRILRDHPTYGPAQVDEVLNAVRKENQALFSSEFISPVEGQRAAVAINRDLNKTNPGRVPKTDAQVNAETALSQELSRQGSEMYQASTGTYGTPNQDWGALKQARDGFFGELKSAQLTDAGKNPGGSGIPTSKVGAVANVVRRVGGRALVPTRAENVSNSLIRTLNESPSRPPVSPIDPIQQQGILDRYTPRASPPPLPAGPEVAAPLSLDDQLNALNVPERTYRNLNDAMKQQIIDQMPTAPVVSPASARRVGRLNP